MQDIGLYLFGVLILLIGLAVSIGLHEIGHLLPAKLFKVKVTQYMIGFGPTVWSRKKGETEYGVKLMPIGGYVSMIGMYPPKTAGEAPRESTTSVFDTVINDARQISSEGITKEDEKRTFYNLPMLKKITVMLGGPFMNLLLAFVFTAVLISGFGVAQASTTVANVSECLVPAGSSATECTNDMAQAPAAAAGILPGDKILSVAGQAINNWDEVPAIIAHSPGKPLTLELERAGEPKSIQIVPAATDRYVVDENGKRVVGEDGQAVIETVGMIGVTPTLEQVRMPLTATPAYVLDNVKAVANIILHMPQRLVAVWNAAFGDGERDLDSPISVVGVGRIAGEIVSHDTAPIAAKAQTMVGLLASLNVALFVFNLVPLLPLDGGHVAGALYEGSKRSLWRLFGKRDPGPIDTAKMVPVTLAVAVLLIFMTVLLVYADIVKPVSLFN